MRSHPFPRIATLEELRGAGASPTAHSPCSAPARNGEVNKTQGAGLPGDSSWLPLKLTKAVLLRPQRLPATAACELLHCRFSGHSACNALGIRVIVFYLFAKSFQ